MQKDWLKKRNLGIGGSDCSTILGLNPYKNNVDLWREKTGRKKPDDISNKAVVQYGLEAEKHLIGLFSLDYPEFTVNHKDFDIRKHCEHDFIIGSLDGELINKDTQKKGILEIKTSNIMRGQQFQEWNNQIPTNYLMQILHYLLVTGFDYAVCYALLKINFNDEKCSEIRTYYFEREDYLDEINLIKNEVIKFWQDYVVADKEPPLKLPQI